MRKSIRSLLFHSFLFMAFCIPLETFADWKKEFLEGVEFYNEGNWVQSIRKFENAIRENPTEKRVRMYGLRYGDYTPYFLAGEALLKIQKYNEAIQYLSKSAEIGYVAESKKALSLAKDYYAQNNNVSSSPTNLRVGENRAFEVQLKKKTVVTYGNYHALIIGVQNYSSESIRDLKRPVQDALRIRDVLVTKYTFSEENVLVMLDPTRSELIDALDNLSRSISNNDSLLIFYAGHGHWDEQTGQGYWLPSDSHKNRKTNWIPNGTIRDFVHGIKSKHTLLITDACFSGGVFLGRSNLVNDDVAADVLYSKQSRHAITSGQGVVPDESVFFDHLLKSLESNTDSHIPAQRLYSQFRETVINNSRNHQIPDFGVIHRTGDEGGDFIFVTSN